MYLYPWKLSRKIIQHQILAKHPGMNKNELQVELFKVFYRCDFDEETLNRIAESMRKFLLQI